MAISNCITHRISRQGTETPVELQLREQVMAVNGRLDELVRELKHAYVGKAGKLYGQFNTDLDKCHVSQWLRECSEEKLSFERFTIKATEALKTLLEDTDLVPDAHILFAMENLADTDVLYVFVIQHNEGVYLDGDLLLQSSHFLDVSGVLLGAKIDMTAWLQEGDASYLSMLRARGDKDFTDLFGNWLGFADQRDIAAETSTFLETVTAYSDTLETEAAQVYRNQVVDYCLEQDKRGEPVVIRELSEHVNTEKPEAFQSFVSKRQEEPKAELIPDRRQLKQFVRLSGRNEQLSMSFAADCLGESIVYDKNTDSLVITNIPGPLKLKLIKHLQENQSAARAAVHQAAAPTEAEARPQASGTADEAAVDTPIVD